nr:uncharacterized protein LOC110438982 [Danio rerio]|eukprot:XP_021328440.1 uncharacterized protein LOC110438982 [Danio rerio]
MKIINVDRKPYLCLFATKDISPGQEITYNYDVSEWPWRNKVTSDTEIQTSTSLSCAGQKTGTQKCCSSKRVTSDTEIQTSTSLSCAGDNTGTQKVTSDTEIQTSTSLSCAGENGGTQKVTSDTEIQTSTSLSCAGENGGTQKVTSDTEIQTSTSFSCAGDNTGTQKINVTSDTEIQTSTSLSCAGDNTGTQKICKLYVISVAVSSLDKCASCSGPYNAFKWVRVKCKMTEPPYGHKNILTSPSPLPPTTLIQDLLAPSLSNHSTNAHRPDPAPRSAEKAKLCMNPAPLQVSVGSVERCHCLNSCVEFLSSPCDCVSSRFSGFPHSQKNKDKDFKTMR